MEVNDLAKKLVIISMQKDSGVHSNMDFSSETEYEKFTLEECLSWCFLKELLISYVN